MHQKQHNLYTPRGVSVSFCLCSAQKAIAFPVHFCVAYLGSVHSPRSARNVGHRFMKNNNQLFFSRSHTCLPFGSNITSTHTCSASLLLHLQIGNIPPQAVCTKVTQQTCKYRSICLFLFILRTFLHQTNGATWKKKIFSKTT